MLYLAKYTKYISQVKLNKFLQDMTYDSLIGKIKKNDMTRKVVLYEKRLKKITP